MKVNKLSRRRKIKKRIRSKVTGTPERPRLTVYRSNKGIYAQLIDDLNGVTLAAANSVDINTGSKTERAHKVGASLADAAKRKNIFKAVFDRNGYLYHGRVKAIADGAREGGLKL